METLEKYRQIVRELLNAHTQNNDPEIECQIICDTEHNHYQLVDIGWQNLHRIYACYIHFSTFSLQLQIHFISHTLCPNFGL